VDERFDGEGVVEIDRQHLIAVSEGHPSGESSCRPPGLGCPEARSPSARAELVQFLLAHVPAGRRQDDATGDHARQEWCRYERTPIPAKRARYTL